MKLTKNIIFDLGGVLLDLDMRRTLDAFRKMGLPDIETMFRIGYASSFFRQYELGTISDREFIESIKRIPGNTGSEFQIAEAWNAMLLNFPVKRVEWLQQLTSRNYRLFLFSNTNAIHLAKFQETFQRQHGFLMDELFEKTYYSHLVKLRKPDPGAYELVLRENELVPAETIFIDDAVINVEAANERGIKGIHLQPGMSVTELVVD